jgi:mono/diheme cytochrome c family protein
MPGESLLAGMALHARIAKDAPKQALIPADEPNLLAGARIYREHCAVCHGRNGQPETAIAKGMFPHPPQLFTGHGVTDDPAGETYWKAANGIRLTGMPGFKASLSETQLWQVSLMLANADKLSPAAKAAVGP